MKEKRLYQQIVERLKEQITEGMSPRIPCVKGTLAKLARD